MEANYRHHLIYGGAHCCGFGGRGASRRVVLAAAKQQRYTPAAGETRMPPPRSHAVEARYVSIFVFEKNVEHQRMNAHLKRDSGRYFLNSVQRGFRIILFIQ